jgi:hypothetical protein
VNRLFAWALLALPVAVPAQAPNGDHLQVFLLTMGAGADIYERFGHNAIWVRDTVAHTDLIYNYGAFEFPSGIGDELAFAGRFAMGRPRYWLGVDSSMEHALAEYRMRQRDLSAQELNLTPLQRAELAARLARNALPENKVYTYDYFRDNCSTRVRDMLDAVLGGALARATRDRPGAGSLRFHTLRSITNDKLLFVGIDASFGPGVDRRIDQWEEMFLPEKVQQRIRELHVRTADGQDVPLVKVEFPVLTIGRYRVEPAPPHWLAGFALAGTVVGALLLLGTMSGPAGNVGRLLVTLWLLLIGLGGLLLLFFWLFTDQVATYDNHNLLFLSPLALGVLPSVWYRGVLPARPWRLRVAGLLALSVVLGLGLSIVPIVTRQDNVEIAALTVLPTLAALWVVAGRLRPVDVDRSKVA